MSHLDVQPGLDNAPADLAATDEARDDARFFVAAQISHNQSVRPTGLGVGDSKDHGSQVGCSGVERAELSTGGARKPANCSNFGSHTNGEELTEDRPWRVCTRSRAAFAPAKRKEANSGTIRHDRQTEDGRQAVIPFAASGDAHEASSTNSRCA